MTISFMALFLPLIFRRLSMHCKEERGFFGLLKSAGNRVARLKTRYDRAENNVEKIVEELEKHQNRLLKDIVMLDKMYDMNREYFRDLTVYIIAGKEKLETEREVTLQRLKEEGRRKRAEAEAELARMEVDLKNKLLEAGG